MTDIDIQLDALHQEIENLKVALSLAADREHRYMLYNQLNQCFNERFRLLERRFEVLSGESGLERSVGE